MPRFSDLGEALSSARSAQNKYWQALALHNLGRVYDSLGDQDRALDFYQQALQLRTADLDAERREGSLQVIGNILSASAVSVNQKRSRCIAKRSR